MRLLYLLVVAVLVKALLYGSNTVIRRVYHIVTNQHRLIAKLSLRENRISKISYIGETIRISTKGYGCQNEFSN